jgi:hypothetical protein
LVLAQLRLDGEPDPFYGIQETVWNPLLDALGYQGSEDLGDLVWWESYEDRSRFYEEIIRSRLDGPALGAIATTKMAHDINEVKARLEYSVRS